MPAPLADARRSWRRFLALLAALSIPATAQGADPADAPAPAAPARVVDHAGLQAALAARPGAPVRVIVEFARPALPDGVQAGTPAGDALMARAIAAAQDALLARLLPEAPQTAAPEAPAEVRRMVHLPMLALNVDAATLARLAQDPAVTRIWPDALDRPMLTGSLPLIEVPPVYAIGVEGEGQTVAVLDTGARLSHEFLSSRILGGACFNGTTGGASSRCPGGAPTGFTLASGDDCSDPSILGCGHGTYVSGIVAGLLTRAGVPRPDDPLHGVARRATILSINVFSRFGPADCPPLPPGVTQCLMSRVSDQIAALDHVYALRTTYTIAAANLSLGGGVFAEPCIDDPRREAILQLLLGDVQIPVVAAAGNDGLDGALSTPACIPAAVTVAASTPTDTRALFSNWGQLVELVAPGAEIRSSYVEGAANDRYETLGNTSAAAAHVSGVIALLRSARPQASLSDVLTAMQTTGRPIRSGGLIRPRINAAQALAALDGNPTEVLLQVPPSATVADAVTFDVTVTSNFGVPPGAVDILLNREILETVALANGQAQLTTRALPPGTHEITAFYRGALASSFMPSRSLPRSLTITIPARPVNDDFAARIPILRPGVVAGDSTFATREADEPNHAPGGGARSLWWTLTPAADGLVRLDTCRSGYDTVLAVYLNGTLAQLRDVAADDDGCGDRSRLSFAGVAGTPYQIVVASPGGGEGPVLLNAEFPFAAPAATETTLSGPTEGLGAQTLTFVAQVTAGPTVPGGTVTFHRNAIAFASVPLDAQGRASVATAALPLGSHAITARYRGAPGLAPSASAALGVTVSVPAVRRAFTGGGAVFGMTPACAPAWGPGPHPVRLHYGPGEVNDFPSQVGILWPTGAEHLQVWQPLVQSTLNFDALGRQLGSLFVLQSPNPRLTPVQRRIIAPAGAPDIVAATEVMLRLRVSNFGGIAGCGATVAGVVRRAG